MTITQLPDLRPLLLRAADVTDDLVHQVGPGDLDRPTPCTDFDVRALVDHLAMVAHRLRVVVEGGDFADVPQVTGAPDAELVATWETRLADLEAALPGVDLGAPTTTPFGTVPVGAAIASYVGELTAHGWDLAVALGRTDLLDPGLAEPVLPSALERIPREGRDQIPFGEVVAVPDEAPALDRLVGWMGRDPSWHA